MVAPASASQGTPSLSKKDPLRVKPIDTADVHSVSHGKDKVLMGSELKMKVMSAENEDDWSLVDHA